MPKLELKAKGPNGETQYKTFTKKQVREMHKPHDHWNPASNGKLVMQDDGHIYEVLPTGWKRRKDIEKQNCLNKKLIKANDTKENDNGQVTITRG